MAYSLIVAAVLASLFPAILSAQPQGGAPTVAFTSGLAGNQVRLTWVALPGTKYRTGKSSPGLDGFSQVALVEPTTVEGSWIDPVATVEKAFYRTDLPGTEVSDITPPLLSPTGGELIVHGQGIPAGSSLVLEIEGGPPISVALLPNGAGVWQAQVTGMIVPGSQVTAVLIVDASGATLVSLNMPITVTANGLAWDGPPSLPPAAPHLRP